MPQCLRSSWYLISREASCNSVTDAGRIGILLLAACLGGCAGSGNDGLAYTADRGVENQPFPANYRAELLAFLRTYLNEPRGVREAVIAEPAQRKVGGRLRYVVCLRFNARASVGGAYAGAKERAAVYIDGRLDRLVENPDDLCGGVTYAAFPELEKLTR
jgi:hypothetical protein